MLTSALFLILPAAWVSQSPCIGESLLTSLFIFSSLFCHLFLMMSHVSLSIYWLAERACQNIETKNFLQKSHYAAENSISEHLNIKIFWGSMPPDPHYRLALLALNSSSRAGRLLWQLNHLLQNFLTTLLNASLSQRCLSDRQSRQTEQNTHLHYMYLLNQLTHSTSQGLV